MVISGLEQDAAVIPAGGSWRVGVMGGMFDPVHTAHLAAARLARDMLLLDVVHLVPCATPNHRALAGASGSDRLNMLTLAIADDPQLRADDRELQRPGVSYMVDTLRSFVEEFPQASLVYILGRDSFYTLPSWYQWRQLLDLCHLAVISRPPASGQLTEDPMPDALRQEVEKRLVTGADELFKSARGRVIMLDDLDLPVSSSAIRQSLAHAGMPDEVPHTVQAYIRQHGLYFSSESGPAAPGSAGRSRT